MSFDRFSFQDVPLEILFQILLSRHLLRYVKPFRIMLYCVKFRVSCFSWHPLDNISSSVPIAKVLYLPVTGMLLEYYTTNWHAARVLYN
jgi:hypothetical protein